MKFDNNAPEWNNPGSEPSEDIQARGFYAGYKPPANIFNWFWYKVSKCIKELQDKLSSQDDNKVDKKQYASITEAGVIKLYSGNNTNRSGLIVDAETGATYVNTKAERGITRDGAGQIGVMAATTDEINAKEQEYKPITPKTLDYAAGVATPDITTSSALTEIVSGDKNSVILGKVQKAISELIKLINLKGATNGFAELDENGLVPSSQLPSYVDDVIECDGIRNFPNTGESGKIYVDKVTNRTYRWSGTQYTEISESLAIGETSSTAYRGDRGKIAYEHSQITSGNPHGTTKNDIGLGNVDNTSDANKPISNATQTALNNKADINSPTFTGTPKAPTFSVYDSSNNIATTKFVYEFINTIVGELEYVDIVTNWAYDYDEETDSNYAVNYQLVEVRKAHFASGLEMQVIINPEMLGVYNCMKKSLKDAFSLASSLPIPEGEWYGDGETIPDGNIKFADIERIEVLQNGLDEVWRCYIKKQ